MMPESDPARKGELLASRICHDLAGPLGVVLQGMELWEEPGTREQCQAAVQRAVAMLRSLRGVFGPAGGEAAGVTRSWEACERILGPLYQARSVRMHPPRRYTMPGFLPVADHPGLVGQLMLAGWLIALHGMEPDSEVRLVDAPRSGSPGAGIAWARSGPMLPFPATWRAVLAGEVGVEDLDAQTILPDHARVLAGRSGARWLPDETAQGSVLWLQPDPEAGTS